MKSYKYWIRFSNKYVIEILSGLILAMIWMGYSHLDRLSSSDYVIVPKKEQTTYGYIIKNNISDSCKYVYYTKGDMIVIEHDYDCLHKYNR